MSHFSPTLSFQPLRSPSIRPLHPVTSRPPSRPTSTATFSIASTSVDSEATAYTDSYHELNTLHNLDNCRFELFTSPEQLVQDLVRCPGFGDVTITFIFPNILSPNDEPDANSSFDFSYRKPMRGDSSPNEKRSSIMSESKNAGVDIPKSVTVNSNSVRVTYRLHRCVLIRRCEYFQRRMDLFGAGHLARGRAIPSALEITLQNATPSTLDLFISHLYFYPLSWLTNFTPITTIHTVLYLAHYFGLPQSDPIWSQIDIILSSKGFPKNAHGRPDVQLLAPYLDLFRNFDLPGFRTNILGYVIKFVCFHWKKKFHSSLLVPSNDGPDATQHHYHIPEQEHQHYTVALQTIQTLTTLLTPREMITILNGFKMEFIKNKYPDFGIKLVNIVWIFAERWADETKALKEESEDIDLDTFINELDELIRDAVFACTSVQDVVSIQTQLNRIPIRSAFIVSKLNKYTTNQLQSLLHYQSMNTSSRGNQGFGKGKMKNSRKQPADDFGFGGEEEEEGFDFS